MYCHLWKTPFRTITHTPPAPLEVAIDLRGPRPIAARLRRRPRARIEVLPALSRIRKLERWRNSGRNCAIASARYQNIAMAARLAELSLLASRWRRIAIVDWNIRPDDARDQPDASSASAVLGLAKPGRTQPDSSRCNDQSAYFRLRAGRNHLL